MHRIAALLLALAFALPASAQDKTLKFVLGYPPGASSDILTRLLAQKMGASLGMTTIVENKTGAGGMVGTEAVKNMAGDANVLLLSPLAPMVAFPHSHGALVRYDPFKDFTPVAHVTNFQIALVVNADLPV